LFCSIFRFCHCYVEMKWCFVCSWCSGLLLACVLLLFSPVFAATRPVDCTLIVDGKSYIGGVCEFVRGDKNGSFSIYGDKYWATVNIENGKGDAYWNGVPYATHAQAQLGEVHQVGGCWEGPKVRICALAIDQGRRDGIMASRPKGLRFSPETWDSVCVSATDYRFVQGAALVMDRCDHFWGLRQRVFQLSKDKVLFEGKPELCIDAKSLAGVKGARLVIDDCASVAIRWTYERDRKVIRSNNNLCWDIPYPDSGKKNDSPSAMIAHPCEQDPEKNGRFQFDAN
jgi:Ricin-type beta-trefoil lectin domain